MALYPEDSKTHEKSWVKNTRTDKSIRISKTTYNRLVGIKTLIMKRDSKATISIDDVIAEMVFWEDKND